MVKIPGLVAAIAECDGRDIQTLDYLARTLRERGALPTTKRGAGAAEITVHDAASLLIGLNAAEQPKDAAAATDRFRALSAWPHRGQASSLARQCPVLSAVMEASTFGAALEVLIDGIDQLVDFFVLIHPSISKVQYFDHWVMIPFDLRVRLVVSTEISADISLHILETADNGVDSEARLHFKSHYREYPRQNTSNSVVRTWRGGRLVGRTTIVELDGWMLYRVYCAINNK